MRLFGWEWSWESKPLRQPWHSLLLAAFSLALLSGSAFSYVSTREFISTSKRATGEPVVVLYSTQGLVAPKIENFAELWLFTLITAVIGLALGTAGLILWVFRHRLFEQYATSPSNS